MVTGTVVIMFVDRAPRVRHVHLGGRLGHVPGVVVRVRWGSGLDLQFCLALEVQQRFELRL